MDCFQDFCLACDRESVDGPYCSQRCRMADLEKANAELSPPVSPTTSSRPTTHAFSSASGYVLAPRFNSTSSTSRASRDAYFVQSPVQVWSSHVPQTAPRALTPSSSRSSLSSNASLSSQSGSGISEQARLELQTYFSSFDQARAAKRRSSTK